MTDTVSSYRAPADRDVDRAAVDERPATAASTAPDTSTDAGDDGAMAAVHAVVDAPGRADTDPALDTASGDDTDVHAHVDTDTEVPGSSLAFPVVGLGASAGGIDALLRFFEHMPPTSGMAFVVVLHLAPQHQSNMAAILQRATPMPVVEVIATTAIEADHVYVIAPTLDLQMVDGHLQVNQVVRPRGRHVAIDVFFRTLATAHKSHAICIVLSGTGADGTVGLTRIKEEGGVTLVQSPSDAEYDAMPLSAIATGMVDAVLPVEEMPQRLIDLWANARRIQLPNGRSVLRHLDEPPSPAAEAQAELALRDIMVTLRSRTGHDFKHYKRATVLRRLERRMQVRGVPTLPAYQAVIEQRPDEASALLKDLLISVTNFFRDREAFDALGRALYSQLFDGKSHTEKVRAWVAGCASGEEAYSIAMLLREGAVASRQLTEFQVFASDIDEQAIAFGRAGSYPTSIATDVSSRRLREFFTEEGNRYRVTKPMRESVMFAVHNVLRDPPFSRVDLVSCRNLLIYLDREVQLQVLKMFHFAMRPGALLFLGSSESAEPLPELFSVVDKKYRIYRANLAPRSARNLPALPTTMSLPTLPSIQRLASIGERPALDQLHRRLLEEHGPPSVVVDESANILHLSEHAAHYLRYVGGTPSHNLLTVVREEIRLELRTAMDLAIQSGKTVEARKVRLQRDLGDVTLGMQVVPVRDPVSNAVFLLVLFYEIGASLGLLGAPGDEPARDPVLVQLEKELQRTHERLQGSIGRSEASNGELKAANEELQAINEELRSATEELETSKEELQSVNEELVTVNQELKDKVDETSKVNDDLNNLIASTEIATVFVDRALNIKRFTPRSGDIFNIIATDVGRPLLDITHRLNYDELEDDANEAFRMLRPVEREVEGTDGRSFLVRVLPYRTHEDRIDGAVLTFIDISATRRAEQRLREGQRHMRLVAESTRDYAIVTFDVHGLLTSWNKGAELIFGYVAPEVIGRSFDMMFTPEDRAAGVAAAELRRARETGRASDERWHLHKDGTRFYCSGITTPLIDGDALRGYAKIARDLTEAKLLETQREQMFATEKQMRSQLQEAAVLKDEFLAVMSHELKHPLNLIHVNAELLTRMPEVRNVPGVARAANVIRRTVTSQAKIIDDLLDLSRMHTGKLSLNFAPIPWQAIAERVVDAVRADADAKHIALRTDLRPDGTAVLADALRVEQIVWNLLSNALKFTPEGGSIDVALAADGMFARLDVADSGQGIEADFLGHVFDMFRQADSRTTRQEGGLGIGLALVKQLSELQGGRVAVESAGRGRGARFSVWLPRSGVQPSDGAPATDMPALADMRIMLVDDAADTLDFFGTLLELEGARVTRCASGAAALAAADDGEFDLILSDVGMPVMDGYQLIQQLRRRPSTAAVPAVALTGYGRPQDERRALEAGFDAHLSKPVALEALIQAVTRLRRKPRPGVAGG